jgi:hypothetical protein
MTPRLGANVVSSMFLLDDMTAGLTLPDWFESGGPQPASRIANQPQPKLPVRP